MLQSSPYLFNILKSSYWSLIMIYALYNPWSLGQYQSLNVLSSLGSIQLCAAVLGATVAIKHNIHLYHHRYSVLLLGWREASMFSVLLKDTDTMAGCSQHSNPHSDDSAVRTQVWCARPLDHYCHSNSNAHIINLTGHPGNFDQHSHHVIHPLFQNSHARSGQTQYGSPR